MTSRIDSLACAQNWNWLIVACVKITSLINHCNFETLQYLGHNGESQWYSITCSAVILAQEGYSYTTIGQKLKRSERWVGKWVSGCLKNLIFVDKSRCGRPKLLSNVAKRFIRSAKYKRGQSLRGMAQQLTARGEAASKNSIRDYMRKELHWKSWRRKKQPLLTESHKKRRIKLAQEH